jgi:hypothetical protein
MFVVQLTAPSGINLEEDNPPPVEAPSPSKVGASPSKIKGSIKEEANEDDSVLPTDQSHD